jgi:hypothetical protein
LFISLPVWWLLFFAIESALLRSKQPEWLNIYSSQKLLFISVAFALSVFLLLRIQKLIPPIRLIWIWDKVSSRFHLFFVLITVLFAIPFIGKGVSVGEDVGGQVKSSLQWFDGTVNAPNFINQPNKTNLSSNRTEWSLRPPGASLLPIPGMLLGLSLGLSIKLALLVCGLMGGMGWLELFSKLKISPTILFIIAILLGSFAGLTTSSYATANIILFSLVPWFIIGALKLNDSLSNTIWSSRGTFLILILIFVLGCFAWIKLSGLIVAGTIGAVLFFLLLKKYSAQSRFSFIAIFAVIGCIFWVPMVALEKTNFSMSGQTADKLYGNIVSDVEAPLTGKHWLTSTRSVWLAWSFVAAPGYALPTKSLANGFRNLGKQFPRFCSWMDSHQINEHVLLAGLVGLALTLILLTQFFYIQHHLNYQLKVLVICFSTIPFIGLAILAYRFQWNYLLYHSHTYEFWWVLLIPIVIGIGIPQKMKFYNIVLIGVGIAFPITKNFETMVGKISNLGTHWASNTELQRGLTNSRFSKAIESIEKDSNNPLDVLFFLPAGDMGDLILRTKMRTLATHFSGNNFPNTGSFKTSQALNVYCAYDSSLASNKKFIDSFDSKFPQKIFKEVIHSEMITVLKITLTPSSSIEQPS